MRQLRVLLDANVIVNSRIRDLFLTAADLKMIEVRWSAEILDETRRALTNKRGLAGEKVERLFIVLSEKFPAAVVAGYSGLINGIDLPDPGDRHVVAAAAQGECDLIVTFNIRDFPTEICAQFDLAVMTPDEAIVALDREFGNRLGEVLESMAGRLNRPNRTAQELVAAFERDAPIGSVLLGARLGLPGYERAVAALAAMTGADTAQSAAWRLVDTVLTGDAERLERLIDPALAAKLTGRAAPSAAAILDALSSAFAGITDPDDWGVGSALRPHGVGVELVKFVKIDDGPRMMGEPARHPGHLFYMRFDNDGWVLTELDGPDPADSE